MLPSSWINEQHGLKQFTWAKTTGPDNVAALMVLMAIAHHSDKMSGEATLTYDQLVQATGVSRSKVAAGLVRLEGFKLIEEPTGGGRSQYRLANYDPYNGWAQFPARSLYDAEGRIWAFKEFHLRKPAELDALKLYLLFAARRDRQSNLAKISYETIHEYSGVSKNNIKRALSLLAVEGLVHVERFRSSLSDIGVVNAYRLAHLDTRRHMGTTGRTDEFGTQEGSTDLPF